MSVICGYRLFAECRKAAEIEKETFHPDELRFLPGPRMDVPPFAATRPEGASDSRSEAEISAAPATKASLCHGKSSAFSLPAVYSREAEWLSRLCRSAGVPRMQDFYDIAGSPW